MQKVLKVYADAAKQKAIAADLKVLAPYDSFLLVEVSDKEAKDLAKKHLVEDVSDQYQLDVGDKEVGLVNAKSSGKTKAASVKALPTVKAPDGRPHHYLVQFIGPIKKEWLAGVRRAGGKPRELYAGFTYVVKADGKAAQTIGELPYVRWLGHLPYEDRIATAVTANIGRKRDETGSTLPRTRILPGIYVVEFFGPEEAKAAQSKLKNLGVKVLETDVSAGVVFVETSEKKAERSRQIDEISAIHGVRQIREHTLDRVTNDIAAGIMGTAKTLATTGLNLGGNNEIIAICDTGLDTGDAATIHEDFRQRIAFIKSYPLSSVFNTRVLNPGGNDGPADLDSGHGTHVAGSVLGDGTVSASLPDSNGAIRGLASKAKLVFQAVEQEAKWRFNIDRQRNGRYILGGIPTDLKTLFKDAYTKGARIHTNSWGGGEPGEYDEQCRQLDEFIWKNPNFCILFAAGNDGSDADGDGEINLGSVTSPGTAKNCITVGASENLRPEFAAERYGEWWANDYPAPPIKNDGMADNTEQVAAFSSRGPTADNRNKPDIVAPGTFILSTRSTMIAANNKGWAAFPSSDKYFHMGGTSMATPLTAGAVALLREYLRTKRGISKPTAALLKAALIAGAVRLPGYSSAKDVVDNHQGYGRVHVDGILAPPTPSKAMFVEVKPGLETGQSSTRSITVKSNSVPLRIVLAYSDFPGDILVNNLNLIVTAPDGTEYVGNQPIDGAPTLDSANNVELVHVRTPSAGSWSINVVGSNVPQGPQPFALVILGHVS